MPPKRQLSQVNNNGSNGSANNTKRPRGSHVSIEEHELDSATVKLGAKYAAIRVLEGRIQRAVNDEKARFRLPGISHVDPGTGMLYYAFTYAMDEALQPVLEGFQTQRGAKSLQTAKAKLWKLLKDTLVDPRLPADIRTYLGKRFNDWISKDQAVAAVGYLRMQFDHYAELRNSGVSDGTWHRYMKHVAEFNAYIHGITELCDRLVQESLKRGGDAAFAALQHRYKLPSAQACDYSKLKASATAAVESAAEVDLALGTGDFDDDTPPEAIMKTYHKKYRHELGRHLTGHCRNLEAAFEALIKAAAKAGDLTPAEAESIKEVAYKPIPAAPWFQ